MDASQSSTTQSPPFDQCGVMPIQTRVMFQTVTMVYENLQNPIVIVLRIHTFVFTHVHLQQIVFNFSINANIAYGRFSWIAHHNQCL